MTASETQPKCGRHPDDHRLHRVKEAQQSGPQEITIHGRPVAVVLPRGDYDRLVGTDESLTDFMRRSPLFEAEVLEFPRDQSLTREVAL